ncbi:DUF4124 domain-containing protein [Pseudomonas citronellolis]|uniref:DUF4124 domain-containing protein n=1 Tax=Pseudomonas citronellolis TaxID=53408 RepID=UPI0023E3F342|nr:DUF4124 domain-containing protein [Pseudomonas citronellolis]MDF3934577.1 DUF4124 domain-containing protein [Pseudomonas citronellolis]
MRVPILLLLLALAGTASAQIYKYTDANGKTVFTNQPPAGAGAQPVDLPPTNTVGAQPPVPGVASNDAGKQAPYAILAISGVPDEEALRANNGTFDVDVIIQPQLIPGHSLQLRLDGQPYGAPSTSTRFTLQVVDRGDHSLAVDVLQGSRVLQSSAAVNFTLQRTSTNAPTRKPPPPKPQPRTGN